MTLQSCKAGDEKIVETISLTPALTRRLHMLGLLGGTNIKILRKKRSGTMIVTFRGVRYAIGAHTAEGIFVKDGD